MFIPFLGIILLIECASVSFHYNIERDNCFDLFSLQLAALWEALPELRRHVRQDREIVFKFLVANKKSLSLAHASRLLISPLLSTHMV